MTLEVCIAIYLFVVRCAIWYHLYNLKNVKNTHGGVLAVGVGFFVWASVPDRCIIHCYRCSFILYLTLPSHFKLELEPELITSILSFLKNI